MHTSLLRMEEVSYRYEGTTKQVLKGISARFDSGRLYCIMGKSGSGKTTLLSLIAGLDHCTGGKIFYGDKDLKTLDLDHYRAKSIGVIFQSNNLLTNTTALENIILSMNISRVPVRNKKQTARELLQKVGIDGETANRRVLKLSGGEQQRVGIARALSHNPGILIADEPTGNLDGENEAGIMEIFKTQAHKEGKCVIVVTHSKSVAAYADEVYQFVHNSFICGC